MIAPGVEIKYANMTTWAGQTFATGIAEGELTEECVTSGQIDVAASSAVLITLQNGDANH